MWKYLRNSIGALFVIITVLAVPASARAQSTTSVSNRSVSSVIISGLWQGVNLDFSSSSSSSSNNSSTSSHSTSSNTASRQPSSVTTPATSGSYAALGDSVAAGVGLPTVVTVPSAESRCGRTREAYPYEVAAATKLPLIHTACSGATAGDLFTKQRSGSPNLPPQLDAAFAKGTPRLITITAGANDAHWVQFLRTCYFTNCATQTQTVLANAYLVALQAKLLVAFPDISARSNGNPPKVLVTGYYNPVSSACPTVTQKITPDEVRWITAEVNSLNQTIQDVVSLFPYARFVPIDFTGHDACSPASWVQGQDDPQPFHPTVQGQHVIAQSVLGSM
jgi:lysophospholipase L1-like esterase